MAATPLASTEAHSLEDSGSTDAVGFAKAILNILDDFGVERKRQGEGQRAVLNILDDIDAEKIRLESTQKAVLNILDDFDVERRHVERANDAMRNFVAVAAHDLRSPLTSIVGFSALLTQNSSTLSDEDRLKFATIIHRQSQNLSGLVDDLFALSSLEGGALPVTPEVIVLAEAIDLYLETGGEELKSVSVNCSPNLLVLVDSQHLVRILDNYLQNAFKYGAPPVRIRALQIGEVIEVWIHDNGPGIAPDFIPKLFTKFARAQSRSQIVEKGAGLGLSIVRGLAEINGGRAYFEPIYPSGGYFVFQLPIGKRPSEK